jgi:transposase-like protein
MTVARSEHRPKNLDLPTMIERYGTEEKCRDFLQELRWPHGAECPRCFTRDAVKIKGRKQLRCKSCDYRFSVTVGTVFSDSHLPLWKWFLATYMVIESKKGISAKQLQRTLGVTYKTAWYLGHRIRSAMEEDSPVPLSGVVEVDETYIGGYSKDRGQGPWANKTMVLGAVAREGEVRLKVQSDQSRSREAYQGFVKDTVADDATHIFTDAAQGWGDMTDANTDHQKVSHRTEEWVRAQVHTNTVEGVWSLLKRSVVGTYHQLSSKHLPAYLDEISFKFNNRDNPYLFRDTLLRLLEGETLPLRELVNGKAS